MRPAFPLLLIAGCGFVPAEPVNPLAAAVPPPPVTMRAAAPVRRPIVVGEVCPDRIGGRPAVNVLFVRQGREWTADPREAKGFVSKGLVPRFAVLSFSGHRVGMFTAAGALAMPTRWPVAVGAYAGASPCVDEASAAECQLVFGACGPAVAIAGVDATEPISVPTAGACRADGELTVDIDGDGIAEVFPLERDRLPEELSSRPGRPATACAPRFAAAGPPDVVAVTDLDGDGRLEVLLQLRRGSERTWAVYSATETPKRLHRVAMAAPWSEPSNRE